MTALTILHRWRAADDQDRVLRFVQPGLSV